jgi:hypothetical protein
MQAVWCIFVYALWKKIAEPQRLEFLIYAQEIEKEERDDLRKEWNAITTFAADSGTIIVTNNVYISTWIM